MIKNEISMKKDHEIKIIEQFLSHRHHGKDKTLLSHLIFKTACLQILKMKHKEFVKCKPVYTLKSKARICTLILFFGISITLLGSSRQSEWIDG